MQRTHDVGGKNASEKLDTLNRQLSMAINANGTDQDAETFKYGRFIHLFKQFYRLINRNESIKVTLQGHMLTPEPPWLLSQWDIKFWNNWRSFEQNRRLYYKDMVILELLSS